MLNRLSLNSKRPDHIHTHQHIQHIEKENNQKNLNRTRRSTKLSQLDGCLFVKQVDAKNYLTNAQTKLNLQSSYNSIQPTIDTTFKPTSRNLQYNTRLQTPIESEKRQSDTQQYCQQYGRDILMHHRFKPTFKTDFLQNHEINCALRARMLDWMVEVMQSYKFSHKTYFAGVQLMDRYLTQVQERVPVTQLHILGVISMYVATKMEQVYPLKLKTVYQKIVHKKISKEAIMDMEMKLFATLGHKTNSWTFYDLAVLKVFDKANIQDPTTKAKVEDVFSYISKCIVYDYQLYIKYDMESLAKVVANIGARICGVQYQGQACFECEDQVCASYNSFKTNFKGLNNIFKFTNDQIVNMVDVYFSQTKML